MILLDNAEIREIRAHPFGYDVFSNRRGGSIRESTRMGVRRMVFSTVEPPLFSRHRVAVADDARQRRALEGGSRAHGIVTVEYVVLNAATIPPGPPVRHSQR